MTPAEQAAPATPDIPRLDAQSSRVGYIRLRLDEVDTNADALTYLAGLTAVAEWVELARDVAARECAKGGASAADLGRALGISRQAASKRYYRK